MKLNYRQKLYFYILVIFLIFFNGGIFSVAAIQNTKNIKAQQENLLIQNNIVLQQIISDVEVVYSSRPQSIPLIIKQHGARQKANGILLQVETDNDEYIYSSFDQQIEFIGSDPSKISYKIDTVNGIKTFLAFSKLPRPFDNYNVITGFSMQAVFDDWRDTIRVVIALSVVFSSIISVVLYISLNRLTKPLMDISSAAAKFGEGNYSVRIKEMSKDELGDTARNFNLMAERITTQMDNLETMANDKQRLIDDISHEMRTPLTAIRGYVEYMQAAKLTDEEYYKTLNIIDRQADRMQKLSEGVLSFTRLRNENADRITAVNVSDLLNDIAKSYSIKAQKDNIYLTVKCPSYLEIKGDRLLFESLIGNLVDNALNACADTTVKRVSISAKTRNDNVVIEIEDTGIGMSKETLENVHKPFFRADKSRSRRRGGAGLGAALCKEIADMYNIDIRYTSQLGNGTTVILTFTS